MLSHQRIRIARALAENDQPDHSERTQLAANVIITANPGEHEADLCMHVSDGDQASARKKLSSTTTGGTPYGASHVTWNRKSDTLSDEEKELARVLGQRVAEVAAKLA